MRNFNSISLDVSVGLKLRHSGFENRLDHGHKGIAGPLVLVDLVRAVGGVVVSGNGEHGVSVELIEADRALVGGLLLLLVEIEFATQVERIREAGGIDLCPT